MNRRRTLPAVPSLTPGATHRELAEVLAPLKEVVETREGLRGDDLQRFVTLEDLVRLGLASLDDVRALSRN